MAKAEKHSHLTKRWNTWYARLTVPADVDEAALKALALADPKVRELLAGKEPRKVIVVPKKLVNIVV